MNKLLIFLAAMFALLFVAPAAQAALPKSIQFGFGDQTNPAMFSDPLFQQLRVQNARYIMPWNTASTAGYERNRLDVWYASVTAANVRPIIAFNGFNDKHIPSQGQYAAAVKATRARYPLVKEYQAWNEANHNTQPATYKNPERAAEYAKTLKKNCSGCTIVPVTLVVGTNSKTTFRWTDRFVKAYGKGNGKAKVNIWGLHTYGAANRGDDKPLKEFLARYRYGKVWMTENATWAGFAGTWKYDLKRQSKLAKNVFVQANKYRSRVSRLYWYQWQGPGPSHRWDSGLLNPDGSVRPVYYQVLKYR